MALTSFDGSFGRFASLSEPSPPNLTLSGPGPPNLTLSRPGSKLGIG